MLDKQDKKVRIMVGLREGGCVPSKTGKKTGFQYNPLLFALVVLIVFLFLLTLLGCRETGAQHGRRSSLDNKFPLAGKAAGIPFKIQSRDTLYSPVHSVLFHVDMQIPATRQDMCAVAQKIVRETLRHEKCHCIAIDFREHGYVDFAPYGKWTKAGEVPIDNYETYEFKYSFVND